MMKKLRTFCFILITALLLLSLVGCSDSKTLEKDQYQISNKGRSFTIKVTDTDINAEDITTIKVKIKYKYVVHTYDSDLNFVTDIKVKTKTETIEVEKLDYTSGNFIGEFETGNSVSEFECEKVVAYYSEKTNSDENINSNESSKHDDNYVSIPMAIAISIACFIFSIIIWFIFSLINFNLAWSISAIPYTLIFLGALITFQWIPALIFLIGGALFAGSVQAIWSWIDSWGK